MALIVDDANPENFLDPLNFRLIGRDADLIIMFRIPRLVYAAAHKAMHNGIDAAFLADQASIKMCPRLRTIAAQRSLFVTVTSKRPSRNLRLGRCAYPRV